MNEVNYRTALMFFQHNSISYLYALFDSFFYLISINFEITLNVIGLQDCKISQFHFIYSEHIVFHSFKR